MKNNKSSTQKAAGLPLSKAAGELLLRLFGPAADEAALILRDQVQCWKAANLNRLQLKWSEKMKRDGISEYSLKQLPFGDALRLVEAASLEDDDEVQDLWASLLHASSKPDSEQNINKTYIDIVRSLTGIEVLILKFLRLRELNHDMSPSSIDNSSVMDFAKRHLRRFKLKDRIVAIENLRRLNLIHLNIAEYDLDKATDKVRIRTTWDELNVDELNARFSALRRLITQLNRDPEWSLLKLTSEFENPDDWLCEIQFRLSDLGAVLMDFCDPKDVEI